MTIVNAASFVAEPKAPNADGTIDNSYDRGTVEATVLGVTKRVRATRFANWGVRGPTIHASGLAVKYRTGKKVWSGRVSHSVETGAESIDGGLDNRVRARFAYLVGFIDDVAADHVAKRR